MQSLTHGTVPAPGTLKTLPPGYFALVMATGIVAISMHIHGAPWAPTALLWLNAIFLCVLSLSTVARALSYPSAFAADLHSHSRGMGFFTLVAAFAVFGCELIIQADAAWLATIFWGMAVFLWLLITYGIFALLTTVREKPALTEALNGGWLVSVVAAQSLAALTVLVVHAGFVHAHEPLIFAALCLWLSAGALYFVIITIIFLRCMFSPLAPEQFEPSYWINMGALAISTLTGTLLLQAASMSPVIGQLEPFIRGVTLSFWAAGTWWIPQLLLLGFWKHVIRKVPWTYDPIYWGGVFPLGMYSVCTYQLTKIFDVPFLLPLSYGFMILAALAWCGAFAGLIGSLFSTLFQSGRASS